MSADETVTVAPDAPVAPEPDPATDARRPRRTTVVALVLAAALVAALAGAVVLWQRAADARDEAAGLRAQVATRAAVEDRARALAVDLTSYDYRDLASQQKALEAGSTTAFRKRFAESNETLAPLFRRLRASAKGSIVDAAVKDVAGAKASVLLFVDQKATSTATKDAKADDVQGTRLRMHLVRQDGRWLLDSVDLL